jgi:hypothetical protein
LLGTDINWLALGDCGSVYPAGQDMSLWEALEKGSLGQLSDADKQSAIERGSSCFQPYGKQAAEDFVQTANYNFQSHRNAKVLGRPSPAGGRRPSPGADDCL